MNQATEKPKDKERLDKIFERAWPDFESDMSAALAKVPSPKPERKLQDMMAEVVETVRHMDRRLDEDLTRAMRGRFDLMSSALRSARSRWAGHLWLPRDNQSVRNIKGSLDFNGPELHHHRGIGRNQKMWPIERVQQVASDLPKMIMKSLII
jgi:hypothetical protein